MKRFIYILTIVIFSLGIGLSTIAQTYKNIYLLGGEPTSWNDFRVALASGTSGFPARAAHTYSTISYGDHQERGLNSCALKVGEELIKLPGALDNPGDNFIIAHSQGGIVSRQLDMLQHTMPTVSNTFGGIVTVGTPNGGAQILNNMDSKLIPFANDACNKLLNATIQNYLASFLNQHRILWPFISPSELGTNLTNSICNTAFPADNGFGIIDVVAGHFKSEIANSYMVGAKEITTLNNFHRNNNSTHRAVFYGTKNNDDIFWRMAYYFQTNPNFEPYFGAVNDYKGVEQAQEIQMDYKAALNLAEDQYSSFENFCGGWLTWCIGEKRERASYMSMISNLKEAISFWESINEKWLDIIGATTVHSGYTTICECYPVVDDYYYYDDYLVYDHYDDDGDFDFYEHCPPRTPPGYECYEYNQFYSYIGATKPSDGVVLKESQMAFPGTTAANQFHMKECSHMQQRNHPELRRGMNKLLNGELDDFFYTE